MNKKCSLIGISATQAITASVVVWLWSLVMQHSEQWFGEQPDGSIGIVAFLLIFIITAVLSASSVLAYPLYLAFHEKDWPKALKLLGLTVLWLAVIAIVILLSIR